MAKKARKPVMVKLCHSGDKKKSREFEMQHALRILQMPNSAWEINDTKYVFEDNDIKRRPSKGDNSSTPK